MWPTQLVQLDDALVTLPLASLELKENTEISRFKLFWWQCGQNTVSLLLRNKYSNLKLQLRQTYSYIGIFVVKDKLLLKSLCLIKNYN